MNSEVVFEHLRSLMDVPERRRPVLLAELCGGDDELRRRLESILAFEDEAEGFLHDPVVGRRNESESDLVVGTCLGPYRIVQLLGRGGMGLVYRAVREADFEKQVVIKLVRRELRSATTLRRFNAERQILARLDHPSIARLLDGGTTTDGRPYLVMELVDGMAIDEYCAVHALSARQRLELLLPVFSAVAYAHRNLVVHRDVKPSNVLVSGGGVPVLLDFGIAKLLDPVEAAASGETVASERPMTPCYASPEQVLREGVSTASDVYSLGVLLYELLTGQLPCVFGGCAFKEIYPLACGDKASLLCFRGKASVAVGDATLPPPLGGDLEAIVKKALSKDPRQRYAGVEKFAEDVRRHLDGLPVRARQGAWAYRTSRFVRRYRWGGAASVLILLFSLSSTALWWQAESARAEAVREQTRAERISEFLRDLFRSADPDASRRGTLRVREVLDQGRKRLTAGLEDEVEVEAALAATLGQAYRNLGLHDEALELEERSARILHEH